MTSHHLKDAAEYVRTSKAPAALLLFIQTIRRIFTFTQERANRLARYVVVTRAYKAGQSVSDIETKYGCSRNTVLRYARMAELPKRPKHLPADIRAAIIADYKKPGNMPVAEIARLHGVSAAYVSKVAGQEGIKRYGTRPNGKRLSAKQERQRTAERRNAQ